MCEINNYIKTGRETKISHYQCSFFECVQVYVARVYKKSHCHNSFFFFITRSLRVSFVFVWCVLCIHIFIYVCMFVCMYVCMYMYVNKNCLQCVTTNDSENLLAGLGKCHPGKGRGEGFRVHLAARALQVIILPRLSIRRLKHQPIKPHVIKPFIIYLNNWLNLTRGRTLTSWSASRRAG